MKDQPNTFNTEKAAIYLGISAAEGKGPRFFRAGDKLIRYRLADLDRWIEARLSQLTGTRSDTNERGR